MTTPSLSLFSNLGIKNDWKSQIPKNPYASELAVGPLGQRGSNIPEGYDQYQLQKFTPEQMKLFSQQFSHLGPESFLSKLASGDQSAFSEMEEPALRQFGALQGNLASRFSGMGTGGRHSSGFQNTMTQAGQNFASDLASERMKTRMNALRELMSFSNQILGQQPYETGLIEPQQQGPGFMSSLGSGLGQAIPGAAIGFLTGGPAGAAIGAGTGLASGFGGGATRGSGGINKSFF